MSKRPLNQKFENQVICPEGDDDREKRAPESLGYDNPGYPGCQQNETYKIFHVFNIADIRFKSTMFPHSMNAIANCIASILDSKRIEVSVYESFELYIV